MTAIDSQRYSGSTEHLLDAIDGVAYIVDTDGIILDVGRPSWDEFARRSGNAGLTSASVTGRRLFDVIDGNDVAASQELLHRRVAQGDNDHIVYEFRCDAPDIERHMRMSIRAMRDRGSVVGVLYQSQILAEVSRVPLPLFASTGLAGPRERYRDDQIVALCSYCQKVAWPAGSNLGEREWIEAHDFYRRGGSVNVALSHSVCTPCYERIVAPFGDDVPDD